MKYKELYHEMFYKEKQIIVLYHILNFRYKTLIKSKKYDDYKVFYNELIDLKNEIEIVNKSYNVQYLLIIIDVYENLLKMIMKIKKGIK